MKIRDCLALLGIRSKPQAYPYEIVDFELRKEGPIQYAQWLHPAETRKVVCQEGIDELRKFLAPGDVAVDIGAHTGDTTLSLALAVGASGCVLAVEPNQFVFQVLKKNSELNAGKLNIIPLMIAATSERGEFLFEYSDAGFCNGGRHQGISKWRHGHAYKLTVQGENLHDYIANHFSELQSRIRFIKIDAEGYDYEILKSLRAFILKQKPFLKVEVFKFTKRMQREQLYDFLTESGYDIFLVESDFNYRGPQLSRTQLFIRKHYDVFCVPKHSRDRAASNAQNRSNC